MRKLVYFVISGCAFVSTMSHAQTMSGAAKDKQLGDIRVWDCECLYGGAICEEEHQKVAIQMRQRLLQMSSVHWKLGDIITSPDSATFSIGVYEGSRIPEVQEIRKIGRATVGCGELVARYSF